MSKKGRLSAQGLDENVIEAFRMYVIERYGKLHTVFGQEIEKAMEAYLENATSTHTHPSDMQLSERKSVEEKAVQAEKAIQKAGLLSAINNGGSVLPNAVKNILGESVGIDPRTINNYYNAFCRKHDLITNLNGELTRI